MNKAFLILGLAAVLLVSGCVTTAEGTQEYDYLPIGQGCGFCTVEENPLNNDLVEAEDLEKTNILL